MPAADAGQPGTLHLAGAAIGPDGACHRPGGVLAREGRAVAWGEADVLRHEHGNEARTVEHSDTLLLPGLVNAHAHFELADIGPRDYTGAFTSWVRLLWKHRPKDGVAVGAAVRRAIKASRAAGIEAVGDIGGGSTGQAEAGAAWRDGGLRGVYYPELIGFNGPRAQRELERLPAIIENHADSPHLSHGVSPHAPYSTGRAIYEACTDAAEQHGLAVTTHLAETPQEHAFVSESSGLFRVFLEELDAWKKQDGDGYGEGLSPVQWMEPYLRRTRWLVAHCNYVSDDDLALLAETGTSVAYCPIASAYFGHEGHRYREMLEAGVNVCLGTDSVVCQPADEPQPHGVLPQMRFLYRRDGTDPALLLRMATTNGRDALRLDDTVTVLTAVRFDLDDATDPLTQVLRNTEVSEGVPL